MSKQAAYDKMKSTVICTGEGRTTLYNLCKVIGVTGRKSYYNDVEKLLPMSLRTMFNKFHIVKHTHDFGLVFKNGFEIRHIDKKIWKLYEDIKNEEIKERQWKKQK